MCIAIHRHVEIEILNCRATIMGRGMYHFNQSSFILYNSYPASTEGTVVNFFNTTMHLFDILEM